ncbi:MAG TPA: hypothetical protein VD930_03620 [Gemmatimonadales bacterium]|nr:hypothetical protein [Gemmatimonadales bacterium]
MACEKCGQDLYYAILKSCPRPDSVIGPDPLPDVPNPTVCMPKERLEEFRYHYRMVSEFAAWVCNVPLKDFAPIHMMVYVKRMREPAPATEPGGRG